MTLALYILVMYCHRKVGFLYVFTVITRELHNMIQPVSGQSRLFSGVGYDPYISLLMKQNKSSPHNSVIRLS